MKLALLFIFLTCFLVNGQHSDFKHIHFGQADSIADKYFGESLQNLPVLTHKLTETLSTDVEKFRAIYTWVSTNIENDYNAYLKTKKKRKKFSKKPGAYKEWNNSFTPKVFDRLLNQKKTACTGYAYLIRELATLADIECKIINGYGRTATTPFTPKSIPNHSWNAVKLNEKWYLCDATWSAGSIVLDYDIPRFKKEYIDGYFLTEPELFAKNHYPMQEEWTLLNKAFSFSEFIEGPIIYKDAFQLSVVPKGPQKMNTVVKKGEPVFFKLFSEKQLNKDSILLVQSKGKTQKNIIPKIKQSGNDFTLQYLFDKSGQFDIHLKVKNHLIATYVIFVKN